MMSRQQILAAVLGALAIISIILYFPMDRSGRVQVTGTIRLDGTPLSVIRGSSVTFVSTVNDSQTAIGLIEEGGRYRLDTTRQKMGIFPGEYHICIKAWERIPGWDDTTSDAPLPPEAVPKRYSDSDTSGVVLEVTAEPRQTIDIDLTSTSADEPEPQR